ncbi:hypothetical protein ACFWP3_04335 [Streptomyces sp. NPDC058525]|uniref:hypothetical protein n=1 Tax=Streptomyces sp. NPDC058525 TaxID=3346538 RepID=UPI003648B5DB
MNEDDLYRDFAAYADVVYRFDHKGSQDLYAGVCRDGPADTVMYRTDRLRDRLQARRFRLVHWGDAFATTGLYRTTDNRRRSNWAGAWTASADIDTPRPLDVVLKECDWLGLPPTMVVESSPDRWHVYFGLRDLLTDVVALQELNSRLVAALDADPSGFDATQLLRPPVGSRAKYGGWRPRIALHEPQRRYGLTEVQEALAEHSPASTAWRSANGPEVVPSFPVEALLLHEVPAVATWLPDWATTLLVDGCADRSSGRYRVVRQLKRQGTDLDTLTALILGSPLGKYSRGESNWKSPERVAQDVARIYYRANDI